MIDQERVLTGVSFRATEIFFTVEVPQSCRSIGGISSELLTLATSEVTVGRLEIERLKLMLAKARRGYAKRGDVPDKKPALTREPLDAILATCDNSLTGLRDHALLLSLIPI